ncbi:MAG TPA: carboxypeptidase regulatory-like domain-containing protein [Candidatus Acidoferrum sp.]|nr:carboxypeptidase regulatory-like domain-containing protein [Candidatus Acidoferrum sp.]
MKQKLVLVLGVLFLALTASPSLFAQANGSFSGNVLDKSGSAITGATVTATSQTTGVSRQAVTDEAGHYLIPLLPVSIYTLRVEYKGFQTVESKDLRLQVDEARELDFTLVPAAQSTQVEVSASAVAVETTNPSLGQVITSQEVSQLPLNGRDFVQLATLTPGATAESNPNSFFTQGADSEVAARGSYSLSVGGSRPNSTDWLLDGVDNNELTAGGIGIFSSIDDIQEFKVLTYNYSAQYGTRAGPTVLVTTKSGSNEFHGSLFEFFRNTSLDAKSFFATTPEKFNLNQFGGAIGGPIRKNKTFFFVDGEQKDQLHGITFTGLLPSMAMRPSSAQPFADFTNDPFGNPVTGTYFDGTNNVAVPGMVNPNMFGASANPAVFPNIYFQCVGSPSGPPTAVNANGSQVQGVPCSKIPAALVNSIGGAMINLYPVPNASNATAGFNFVSEPVRSLYETKLDARLDHTFSANDTAFARFSYDDAVSYVPGGFAGGFAEASAFGSNQGIINHARNIAIAETHVFSPTTVNEASFGYNRIFDYISSQGTGSCASAKLGIPGANLGCSGLGSSATCTKGAYSCGLVSTLFINGYWSLGDRGYTPFQGGTNIFTFADSLDLIRGKHEFKVGIDVRANQMNVGTEAFQDGFWIPGAIGTFSGLALAPATPTPATPKVNVPGNAEADFVMGLVGVSEHDQTFNGPVSGRRWKIVRPYVQDDWRLTKDLTLNLGLAWDLTSPVSEVGGRLANYLPPTIATGANASTGQLLIASQGGVNSSAGIQRNWTAFEPRIGFAYKLLGSDKTVIRGGYSIYHDSAWSMGAQGLWQNPPFFAEGDIFSPAGCAFSTSYCATVLSQTPLGSSISNGFPIFTTPPNVSTFTGTFFYQPTNFKIGKVQQFNVNVEHQVLGNIVLTAGYAGSRGNHILVYGNDLNTSGPSGCGTISGYTLGCASGGAPFVSPYNPPNFNAILEFGDLGKTNYDSLQIKAETKSTRHGIYALIGYSYSNTYDNGLTDGLGALLSAPYFPLPNWQKLDWAPSQLDVHNSFTASVIYDLPFGKGKRFGGAWNNTTDSILGGWQVTLIEKITSGFADPLIDSANNSGVFFNAGGNGNNYNRPDQVAGCSTSANQTKLQFINPACFTQPLPGALGNASRVPVFGPDFVNSDFSLIKQFKLPWENMGLNFRAEFFNLFNHAQFGQPVSDINAPGFGAVNSTVNNPRLVQLGLKLTF